MTKANSQKNDEKKKAAAPQIQLSSPQTTPTTNRNRGNKRSQRPQIGGTAVAGARSTIPKAPGGVNPAEQQYESSNRDMRRRTRRMGTDPQSQLEAANSKNPRQKRLEKRRQQLEERRAELRKSRGAVKIDRSAVNRRSLLVFLGVLAVIVVIVLIAILVRHPFG